MLTDIHLLIPATLGEFLQDKAGGWGYLDIKFSAPERLGVIVGASDRTESRYPVDDDVLESHFTKHHPETKQAGLWYRVDPAAHRVHEYLALRRCAMSLEDFQALIQPDSWKVPPRDQKVIVLAVSQSDAADQIFQMTAWCVTADGASPTSLEQIDGALPAIAWLRKTWPVDQLACSSVGIVGVGSIGGYLADSLAAAGVGTIHLIDPDRLQRHNVARHVLGDEDIGRLKVTAVRERLLQRHAHTDVRALALDVEGHADLIRPLFDACDLIAVASDGVLSRSVANHLARTAGKPIVFVAVHENGAVGEVVRVRSGDGCLTCLRLKLVEDGLMDPEPALDAGYGTGTYHLPMTAAPGDLRLMGEFAAKAAVATLLESNGHWEHRLPGGWMLVGLQPNGAPPPFDVERAGELRWADLPARRPDCFTCCR